MDPIYKNLANELNDKLHFAQVNVDLTEMRDYYKQMGIVEIPSFALYQSKDTFFVKRGDSGMESFIQEASEGDFEKVKSKWQYQIPPPRNIPEYELLVIGGGSGGVACARHASKLTNGPIAIVDFVVPSPHENSWDLGGTCVNVGCVPKYLYHRAALIADTLKEHASYFGWRDAPSLKHDWQTLWSSVHLHVKKLNWKYERALRLSGVEYIHAFARFIDTHSVEVTDSDGNKKVLKAKNIIIATGGRPVYPDFPGANHCITSDDIFFVKEPLQKTLVIGGSYIALETAGFLAGLGGDVTLSVRSAMLKSFDLECVLKVALSLKHVGVKINMPQIVKSVEKLNNNQYKVIFDDGSEDIFTNVIVATGRAPNTSSLNLSSANIRTNSSGYIETDSFNRTSAQNIYAIGDVIQDGPELTPVAILSGKLVAQRIFRNSLVQESFAQEGNIIPTCIFTPNEYSSCGLTESEAIEKYGRENLVIYKKVVRVLENELNPDHPHDAFGKLICLKQENEKVIGFHFVGPKAGEVCQGIAVAMRLGATKSDFDLTVGIHPTLAELFCSLELGVEEDVGCGCG